MKTYRIATIPGDGIGQEVLPVALDVLHAVGDRHGFKLEVTEFPWSCDYYLTHGRMMDADALERMASFDAIYLGAVGVV